MSRVSEVKKLISVLATSTSTTGAREEALERVPCIHYPVQFKNTSETQVQVLIDSRSEINAIHLTFAKQLGLPIRPIDVRAQKIDSITLDTYGIVVAVFSVEDKANQVRFFEETFLVANISPEVVLGILSLILNGADIDFSGRELQWRTYTTKEVLPTTRRVELVGKKEFAAIALDPEHETYVVHVASLSSTPLAFFNVHPSREPQISGLIAEKAPTKVPAEYLDFADVFSLDLVTELPEHIEINTHAIDLKEGKQPPYGPIYSLGPVELEIFKAYIETNLANGFIRPLKFPASAPILFDKKPDGSLCLCVNYRGLNNIIIKNQYLFVLVSESLDCLGHAKQFTQLDLTSAYHRMRIKEDDEWKTAFRTRYGHFEYQVMPFGLTNAPGSFQGYVNKILAEKLNIFVIVYLDDILIYTEDPGKAHVEAVRWVLGVLRKYGLYANLKKCRFHKDEVRFLGFVVSRDGIRMEEERIDAVKKWPEPQSVRDIQVFIGFANFYRRFIKGFSRIAAPLTAILETTGSSVVSASRVDDGEVVGGGGAGRTDASKNSAKSKKMKSVHDSEEPKFLTSKAKKAFNRLRQAFTKVPILQHFDPECHIRIETNALGYAIGRVLSQLTPNQVTSDDAIG